MASFFDIYFQKDYNVYMTVVEASAHLYQWFSENDSFSMKGDFIKVINITETPNRDRAAFECALKKYEESGMVSVGSVDDEQFWILRKAFVAYDQSVTISPHLALTIAEIINKFCELVQNEVDYCDPTEIKESDINNLIYIANILLADKKKIDSDPE
jgi:hypothetical protein